MSDWSERNFTEFVERDVQIQQAALTPDLGRSVGCESTTAVCWRGTTVQVLVVAR